MGSGAAPRGPRVRSRSGVGHGTDAAGSLNLLALRLLLLDRHHEADMSAGHHEERHRTRVLGPIVPGQHRILDREELAIALVQVVGEPAAVALTGEREAALDAVPLGLEDDALTAQVRASGGRFVQRSFHPGDASLPTYAPPG